MTETPNVWSYRLARDEVPEEGLHVEIDADASIRAALTRIAGLRELPRLAASFYITRSGQNGLHIIGEVTSTLGQECVITLEPIDKNLIEPIDLTFVPNGPSTSGLPAEASLSGDEPDLPEPLEGGAVDLGAIATEYFLLGIDPYPRKPGAVFEAPGEPQPPASPFAALSALKKSGADKG